MTSLSQGSRVYVGTINASPGGAVPLGAIRLTLPLNDTLRRLYFALVVDDVTDFRVEGSIDFRQGGAGGNPVLSLPVRVSEYTTGWGTTGGEMLGEQCCVLPSWSATRWLASDVPNGITLLDNPLLPHGLTKGFLYNDTAAMWAYRVVMAPFPVEVAADAVTWTPTEHYGVARASQTMCAVVLAVASDSR